MKCNVLFRWIVPIPIFVLFCVTLSLPQSGYAQSPDPTPASQCAQCHESVYLLHDTGKWFCACASPMTCTCCHGGDAQAYDKDIAHLGMVTSPVQQDAVTCQSCHQEDYQEQVDYFASVAGIQSTHPPLPTCAAPLEQMLLAPTQALPGELLSERLSQPWRLAGLGVALAAFLGSILAGISWWKFDRTSS